MAPIVGRFVAYIIGFALVSLLVAGIILLLLSATRTSTKPAENAYEHFDTNDDYLSNLRKRTDLVKRTIDTLRNDMDVLDEDADDTCEIMKIVEDTFISNKSMPSDESEFELPQEIQQVRINRRSDRAKKSFQELKNIFAVSRGKLLECFASTDDVDQAELDLNDVVKELTLLLDSAEMKLAVTKGEKTWMSLLFTAPYLKKAVEITTAKTSENFDIIQGGILLSKADELIGKANTIHERLKSLRNQVAAQKAVARSLNKKVADLQKGNVSQSDIDAGVSHATT